MVAMGVIEVALVEAARSWLASHVVTTRREDRLRFSPSAVRMVPASLGTWEGTPVAGRDQIGPMQRIVRIMAMLDKAGPVGVTGERLASVAGFGEKDPGTQLNRDFRHLRDQGWQIDNIAGPGEPARYRMVSGDNRLRVGLDPAQVAALQRAMILADRADLAQRLGVAPASLPTAIGTTVEHHPSAELSTALEAVRRRSRLRFSYKGNVRTLHPSSVRYRNGRWYLSGVEEGGDVLKHFVVGRMSGAEPDAPGTAEPTAGRETPMHPLHWEVDPPVEVVLRASLDYEPDVVRLLLAPTARAERDGVVDLTYTVTHRAALRARIYALGRRVQVVSPAEVREEILAELRDLVGA
jgi:predicted DNA-binding transcriptional regulator YafY